MNMVQWPHEYIEMREFLKAEWGVRGEVNLFRQLNGSSGAFVYAVDLDSEIYSGVGILKLYRDAPVKDEKRTEEQLHRDAISDSPAFAAKHFPKLIRPATHRGVVALLYEIVEAGLEYTQTLSSAAHDDRLISLQKIAAGLLREWNTDYSLTEGLTNPKEILAKWLGYRLDPSQGRVFDFLGDSFDLTGEDRAFSFRGTSYPNPYVFASADDWVREDDQMRAVVGRIHGDLHSRNVLIRRATNMEIDYYLIDFALYQTDVPLFYDHAYLELSELLLQRGECAEDRWVTLVDATAVVTNRAEAAQKIIDGDDVGIGITVAAIREQVLHWIAEQEDGRRAFLERQYMLARIAAGLNFTNKKVGTGIKKKAFLYAAEHLRRFLQFGGDRWSVDGKSLTPSSRREFRGDSWRSVWKRCDDFNSRKSAFILILGPGAASRQEESPEALALAPWSMILDFNSSSPDHGVHKTLIDELRKRRNVHMVVPSDRLQVNFHQATVWLLGNGYSQRPETVGGNFKRWRRMHLEDIGAWLRILKESVSPRLFRCVVILDGLEDAMFERTWEGLDNTFGDDLTTMVLREEDRAGGVRADGLLQVDCMPGELFYGLNYMLSVQTDSFSVFVPGRVNKERALQESRVFVAVTTDDLRYMEEEMEIVHAGLALENPAEEAEGLAFLKGFPVSWKELDMNADIDRDIRTNLQEELYCLLDSSRNATVQFEHMPGAGGTSVAKRIAWELKGFFPTVVLHSISESTGDRLQRLFKLTALPIFVVIEAGKGISVSQREGLYKKLKQSHSRAVFLYVMRNIEPASPFRLEDPMGAVETNRFLKRYRKYAPSARHQYLDRLANNDEMRRYRSPFFFGLFAFEEDFVHVRAFVSSHLEDLPESAHKLLTYLALMTRYSQASMKGIEINMLIGVDKDRAINIGELVGVKAARLVLWDGNFARIVHPIIGEQVLMQLLGGDEEEGQNVWTYRLAGVCKDFIADYSECAGEKSDEALDTISQMFISRSPWSLSGQKRKNFSELVLTIPSDEGQHRVLKMLTESFPDEAHFWNHLGRHANYAMKSNYEVAAAHLKTAIDLEKQNSVHYHALGMIYRFEIKRRLTAAKKMRQNLIAAFADIRELFAVAQQCFRDARRWDEDSEYPHITYIQLVVDTVRALSHLGGKADITVLLQGDFELSRWVRDAVGEAERSLFRVKALQAQSELSQLTVECDANLRSVYGDFELTIKILEALFSSGNAQEASTRRMLADAYYANRERNWSNLTTTECRRIALLMSENLEEKPGSDHDMRMWFQAFRRLPEFDILEAIDRIKAWATREGAVDAYYYLYVLHFILWYQGQLADHSVVRSFMEKCQRAAVQGRGGWSYEWLDESDTACPLRHHSELGEWVKSEDDEFYERTERLALVNGVVSELKGPQAGTIVIAPKNRDERDYAQGSLEVFFVPRSEILRGRDENQLVQFYLGFSYEGLRAWSVERI